MMVDLAVFLLLNLALGFYNLGTIWAHEIDIFRSWDLLSGFGHALGDRQKRIGRSPTPDRRR